MKDPSKTGQALSEELKSLRLKIAKLEQSEADRKKAEAALRESEELYTRLVNAIPDVIVRMDLDGRIHFINDYALRISGYSREEIVGRNMMALIAPGDRDRAMENTRLILQRRLGPREYRIIMKDGREVPFEVNGDVLRNEDGTPFGIVNVCRDISERKRTERILRENEERLYGIAKNLPGAIFQFHVKDSGEYRLSYISERLNELYGFPSDPDAMLRAFLDHLHEEDRDRFIESYRKAVQTASAWNFEGRGTVPSGGMIWFQVLATPTRHGDELIFNGLLLNITERKQAEERSRQSEEKFHQVFMTTPDCLAIARIQDGVVIDANKGYEDILGWKREEVVGEKLTDPRFNFWVDLSARGLMLEDLKDGRDVLHRELKFRRCDGSVRTGIYSARFMNIGGESCFIFLLQDITGRKREEEEFQRTLESLRNAVGATIQVMVSAVEARDPYTAGHQIRSADLARAIATEMGLCQDRINGIRMAGSIHDIGKLSIPAEILSKPTQLTALEFSLIREHPRKGYEMLKDVESPWPLAQIVHQHHERIDGSGYPGNLKGDDILTEARVLAVADVVESMASHRPYRPALGIEDALQEIEKNKGTLYDEAAAEACLRLFRLRGYRLP